MKSLILTSLTFALIFISGVTYSQNNNPQVDPADLEKFEEFKRFEEFKKKQSALKENKDSEVKQLDEKSDPNKKDSKETTINTLPLYSPEHLFNIGYDFKTVASFEDGWISTSPGVSLDNEMEFETGLAIGYEYRISTPNSWGKSFGINYHTERDLKTWEINGIKAGKVDISVTILSIYADLIYRWESFYIPFGVNLSSINYKVPTTDSGSIETNGSFGVNLGFGWKMDQKKSIEYITMNTAHLPEYDDGIDLLYFGDGYLTTSTILFKYQFK
jgi:hypothetical protein